jgi:hypothetical protein
MLDVVVRVRRLITKLAASVPFIYAGQFQTGAIIMHIVTMSFGRNVSPCVNL